MMTEEQLSKDVVETVDNDFGINGDTLAYTGRNVTKIPEVFSKLQGRKVQHLDLSFNSINRLNGLEGFVVLKELILDNNEIDDNAEFPLMSTLRTLSLNNNKITDLTLFVEKVKKSFPNLTFLSLLGNKACQNELSDLSKDDDDYRRYRCFVLHHLGKLKFLDSTAVTSTELEEAAIKGRFMQIKKPKILGNERQYFSSGETNFHPLPNISRPIGDHRGAYATFKYRYANKDSEGNRFIVNKDL